MMIYLIPGRGEDFDNDLGIMIRDMAHTAWGRVLIGDFARLRFSQQLALITQDIKKHFWNSMSILVGQSYGAYLILHALAELEPFPGDVLLFSPVLGEALSSNLRYGSKPPRAKKLFQLAQERRFPPCRFMEVHTGADDADCDPQLAKMIVPRIMHAKLFIVPKDGHNLDVSYIRAVLNRIGAFTGHNYSGCRPNLTDTAV